MNQIFVDIALILKSVLNHKQNKIEINNYYHFKKTIDNEITEDVVVFIEHVDSIAYFGTIICDIKNPALNGFGTIIPSDNDYIIEKLSEENLLKYKI